MTLKYRINMPAGSFGKINKVENLLFMLENSDFCDLFLFFQPKVGTFLKNDKSAV